MGKPVTGEVVVLPFPQTFTVEQSVILYASGKVNDAKLKKVRAKNCELFA